jgi:hypothetical protein
MSDLMFTTKTELRLRSQLQECITAYLRISLIWV